MELFNGVLFQEICSRGCTIIIQCKNFSIENLPKCLVQINDDKNCNPDHHFTIKSLVSDHAYIDVNYSYEAGIIAGCRLRFFLNNNKRQPIYEYCLCICIETITNAYPFFSSFDELIWKLHYESEYNYDDDYNRIDYQFIKSQKYEQIVKNKMLQEMIASYALKFMYIDSILFIELKMIIVNYLIKLDKWHNLKMIDDDYKN